MKYVSPDYAARLDSLAGDLMAQRRERLAMERLDAQASGEVLLSRVIELRPPQPVVADLPPAIA